MNTPSNNEMLSNVNTDNILRDVLANFDTYYIIDIIRNSITMRFRPYNTALPGLNAIEMRFQMMLQQFTDEDHRNQIMEKRSIIYDEIIAVLCKYFNLTYKPNEDIDNYSVAYSLYNVLVSNFTGTIISFFVNYIVTNQDTIFQVLNTEENKNDINTYSKKIYSGISVKLAVIHSHITTVMDNIAVSDIRMEDILRYGGSDPQCSAIILNTIIENSGVFAEHFAPYLRSNRTRAELITNVKLRLQQFATADINIIAPIKEES